MKIKEYLKKLLPVFGRDRLQEDIGMLTNELNSIVLPAYALAIEQNGRNSYTSAFYKEVERVYKLMLGNPKGNLIADINTRLAVLPETLAVLAKIAQDEFQAKIVTEALTARKANVLRAVEVIGFINKFSLTLLNALVTKEIEAIGNSDTSADVPNGELKRLQKYLPDFLILIKAVTTPKSIEDVIYQMPEVAVDDSVFNGSFDSDMDPLGLFAANNFRGNPAYAVGMIVAEWQNNRYKHMLEQRKALELRLTHMKRRLEKQEDPVLEKEIELTASRVAKIAEKIRSYEEALG